MKRYFIEDVKYGLTDDGIGCGPISASTVASIKFKEDGKTQWLSVIDDDGIPNFYLTDRDVFEDLIKEDFEDKEFYDYMEEHFIEKFNGIQFGTDYMVTLECFYMDPENPAIPLVQYLIDLINCEEDNAEHYVSIAIGKYADEINDAAEDFINLYGASIKRDAGNTTDLSKEELYKMRLTIETDLATESVFNDMDSDEIKRKQTLLRNVKAKTNDNDDYKAWKEAFVSEEYARLKGKKFLTCEYVFAGIGQYETVIPEEGKNAFVCWIRGCGSAFWGEIREATEEEVKKYISLHAYECDK